MSERGSPPPVPRKPQAPVRKYGRGQTPEQLLAVKRIRGAKLCNGSRSAAMTGFVAFAVGFVIPPVGMLCLPAAALGIGLGVAGLLVLARTGLGPVEIDEVSPVERVSSQMAHKARRRGSDGIVLSFLLAGLVVGIQLLVSR